MIFSSSILTDIQPYHGNSKIHAMDGESLPIESIRKFSHSLPLNQVFYSPPLSSNLLSVGQLIDNNSRFHFLNLVVLCEIRSRGKFWRGVLNAEGRFLLIISTPPLNKSLLSVVDTAADNNVF